MSVHNSEVAQQLNRLADLLEVEGANPFRVRAYRNASRTVGSMGESLAKLVANDEDLAKLPGIGEGIAEKIETLVKSGHLPQLEEIEKRTPANLSELMKIEGLGPQKVKALHDDLNIRGIDDLIKAARKGAIRQLSGFGAKTEAVILERAERFQGEPARTPLPMAEDIVEPLLSRLEETEGVKHVTVAGSFRRCKETVGDLDIVATARRSSPVMDRFTGYEEVTEVVSRGKTRSTVVLHSGLHVDLRVVPEVSYGSALCYFTGSKAHNIAIRKLGTEKGYKINEYGVFRGKKRVAGKTEASLYRKLGMDYVPPELRENRGEIKAAKKGDLPELVSLEDIRGDLHCHTTATDGHNSLREMVAAADERGYEYLAITDHSKKVTVARGLTRKRLLEEIRAIDKLKEEIEGPEILKSAEVDILEDGSLDLPDSVLRELDLVVCSVHYGFRLSEQKETERIIRAMDNPLVNIIAHPTGRLINEREPYPVDLERVLSAAAERGCFLEVNAQPSRLDLTDTYCKLARDMQVKLAVSTDAHSIGNLDFMRYGINQARRGWASANDVINTRSLKDLRKLLKRN